MKKIVLLCFIIFNSFHFCKAQEWFTSFEVAKRMALIQNKMLFVIWEDSLNEAYPIAITIEKGNEALIDLSENNKMDSLIWDHFIPVLLPEYEYSTFFNKVKNKRKVSYINKLNDDSVKIMDINGNILNLKAVYRGYDNLSLIINKYALNTSFLKQDLVNYSKQRNFTTALNLAAKYIDYAILVDRSVRSEVIGLGEIYLNDARQLLDKNPIENKEAYSQRLDLISIKTDLIFGKYRKANRTLKKVNKFEVADFNKSLFSFLKYITFKSVKDEENATLWKEDMFPADLKKAEFILKNNN